MRTSNFILLSCLGLLCLAGGIASAERELAGGKKQEVRHSMIGPRDTLLFYTFEEAKAVLRLQVARKADGFTVTGQVFLFDPSTDGKNLAKWVNNQHSDALFADAPEPVATSDLPAEACAVTGSKDLGESKQHTMEGAQAFRDHEVAFSIKDLKVDGKFQLKAFDDTTRTFVRAGGK
jgi:hypothetical protein